MGSYDKTSRGIYHVEYPARAVQNLYRNLLRNRGFGHSSNNTYPIFLTPCIRCTNHLCDSCDLTNVNPHFFRHCSERFKMLTYCHVIDTRADRQQLWRHNDRLFPRGCYGRFLSTMMLISLINACANIYCHLEYKTHHSTVVDREQFLL